MGFESIIKKLRNNDPLNTTEFELLKSYTNCSEFNEKQKNFVENIVTKIQKQKLTATEVNTLVNLINIVQTHKGCSGFRSTNNSRKYKFHPIYGKLRY